ncbi:hypothetical protein F5B22DRAFT_623896 [Xylaria bambusicola]|uniref:uncharacterized protein n=1 Tax=Xylaria bambusicola TaxID=326684 RepID=UPI002008C3B3|nr:uncharacterized protein F5B22DRAFT_623896 [Xylaria bambusicola]KAI0506347.1 hypothetical protein F5B22DRAFT_623896 [Xylaria bambusicola]
MSRPSTARRQLYFAYGSNLWLEQMATRCPHSYYVGRAVLPDYRWLINERGFANIVPASGYTVHGLVYELGVGDEPRLDRSEGVSKGVYSKDYLPLLLHQAPRALQISTQSLAEDGSLERAIGASQLQMTSGRKRRAYLQPRVLVYISYDFVAPGDPRTEYTDRMNYGIRDAATMGVPEDYFQNALYPLLGTRPAVHNVTRRQSLRAPGGPALPPPKTRSRSTSYPRKEIGGVSSSGTRIRKSEKSVYQLPTRESNTRIWEIVEL